MNDVSLPPPIAPDYVLDHHQGLRGGVSVETLPPPTPPERAPGHGGRDIHNAISMEKITRRTPYNPPQFLDSRITLQDEFGTRQAPPAEAPNESAPPPPRNVGGISWVMIISAILSSAFLFAIDNTITADIQSAIVRTYDDTSKLPWISVSFLLTAAGTSLLW